MKLAAFALILAVAVVGCQSAPSTPSEETPKPTPVAQEPKPAEPAPETPEGRLYALEDLQTAEIGFNGKKLKVWIMDDPGKRQEGMMFLKAEDVPKDMGMLFVFPEKQEAGRGFWMHNTLIPLDITYISPKGVANETAHGKVKDDTNLPAKEAFQFVLELPAGEAKTRGIVRGTKIEIPADLVKNAT